MKKSRFPLSFLMILFVSVTLTGLGQAQIPKMGGTLIIATAKDPQSLDIQKDVAIQGVNILHQVYEGLINFDDEGNLIPGLAESMPNQPNPTTYIFTLRKGVIFHNGADFDARDVKFTFDRLLNKQVSRYWKAYEGKFKSIEILDPYKLRITLTAPATGFLNLLAKMRELLIIPRGAGDYIKYPIGTGPFKFKEWIKDDRLVLVKNEHYREKGLPYLDQIIYKPFPEETTRVINLKTGIADMVHNLPILAAVELKKIPQIKVLNRSGAQMDMVWLNTTKPPFDNKKVRQAIAYGIDREAIVKSVFMGFAEVAQGLCPSWFWAYIPDLKPYPYDPEKATALLKEAGYSDKNPLSFTLSMTNEQIFVDQGVIIQAQLAKIGVKVTVLPLEKSYWFDSQLGRMGRDYEATMNHSSDEMTDETWIYRHFSSKSYFSFSGYNNERYGKRGAQNPEVDRLLDEVVKISDRNEARKMYDKIQRMILNDIPIIRLAYPDNIIGMKDYVKNHKILTRNNIPLKKVWVDK